MDEEFDAIAERDCSAWITSIDSGVCGSCSKQRSVSWNICGRCRMVGYCDQTCQKKHWILSHKKYCATIPLFQACFSGNPEHVRAALELTGVRKDMDEPQFGYTPVSICTIKGFCDCLSILLAHGVDIAPAKGFTPVHFACLGNKIDCLQVLAEHGADMNGGSFFYNATTICSARGHVECLYICLNHGGDPNQRAPNNTMASHAASQFGNFKCLQLLIRRGASLEIERHAGVPSPIDFARVCNHPECIGLLLAEGAYFYAEESVYIDDSNKVFVCSSRFFTYFHMFFYRKFARQKSSPTRQDKGDPVDVDTQDAKLLSGVSCQNALTAE